MKIYANAPGSFFLISHPLFFCIKTKTSGTKFPTQSTSVGAAICKIKISHSYDDELFISKELRCSLLHLGAGSLRKNYYDA